MDGRRELTLIRKQLDGYHRRIGESILWAPYNSDLSFSDPVYNEPGRRVYDMPVVVPTLWINKVEAGKRLDDERIDLRNHISFAVSAEALRNVGVPNIFDDDQRVFDLIKYWGKYWSIADYDVMGRFRQEDSSTIAVLANEVDVDGDYPFENPVTLIDTTGSTIQGASTMLIYTFTQPVPADVWTIPHGLGHYPVSVLVRLSSGDTSIEVPREDPDTSTTVLTFNSPESGTAYLI